MVSLHPCVLLDAPVRPPLHVLPLELDVTPAALCLHVARREAAVDAMLLSPSRMLGKPRRVVLAWMGARRERERHYPRKRSAGHRRLSLDPMRPRGGFVGDPVERAHASRYCEAVGVRRNKVAACVSGLDTVRGRRCWEAHENDNLLVLQHFVRLDESASYQIGNGSELRSPLGLRLVFRGDTRWDGDQDEENREADTHVMVLESRTLRHCVPYPLVPVERLAHDLRALPCGVYANLRRVRSMRLFDAATAERPSAPTPWRAATRDPIESRQERASRGRA